METNQSLKKKMAARHITMIALGGAIGAGLFKGSSSAIAAAGPSVLIAYFIGGIVLYFVMKSLEKLVLSSKDPHGLSGLVQPYLGNHTADFTDWVYWSMWMINIIAEAVAAASFLQLWFANVPTWVFVLIIALLTSLINLFSVALFAETEYWLAFIKISVVILLIIFGVFLVAKQIFDTNLVTTFSGMTAHGGFAPHGFKGVINSLLIVIYSYGGSELIAITVSETEDPKRAIPKAIRGVIGRIISFYIIPMFLLLVIYNWQTLATSSMSPFVMVFNKMHIPFAGDIVNLIIILALFSSINSGIYASSRLLYFRLKNRQGKMAQRMAHLNKHHVPQRAVIFCSGTLYIGVVLSYFVGDRLFNYLAGSLSYTVLAVWILISLAGFGLSLKTKSLSGRTMSLLALIALFLILIGILFTNPIGVTVFTAILYFIIFISYRKKNDSVSNLN
ncbi:MULTISPECIES: amino acid permease [Lactococcus]|uniref:AAT family amino acid transporter n=3 Tax=Lactococcus lactis TaxID=1358 RepID=A0A2A9I4D3_9LACT|nr:MULTISPECIES: amino acid permease [Lactococcus]AGY43975.1 amino acid permease [Lactococcus lactis subsp. lactis KLDS 4.0325]MDT3325605.1 amino acid permease [Bacillota bacterium]ADZ63431.1 GABA-specific permease [Lactococcus lactis subsp. lactis CV56]ARD93312.1 amino acid/polyamine/organocation transporter APC superfamily [Lactococcus lactis subsp. lactis]ARD98516.1 amino acid/polyamine/organocation transporter APC superfamily [Lactococcus lactis subsp. lactis]